MRLCACFVRACRACGTWLSDLARCIARGMCCTLRCAQACLHLNQITRQPSRSSYAPAHTPRPHALRALPHLHRDCARRCHICAGARFRPRRGWPQIHLGHQPVAPGRAVRRRIRRASLPSPPARPRVAAHADGAVGHGADVANQPDRPRPAGIGLRGKAARTPEAPRCDAARDWIARRSRTSSSMRRRCAHRRRACSSRWTVARH